MKILEQPELLFESGVNGELSAKRIGAKKKVEDSLLLVHPGFPVSISHGYLVEISQHRIHQFVGRFHRSHLLNHLHIFGSLHSRFHVTTRNQVADVSGVSYHLTLFSSSSSTDSRVVQGDTQISRINET
jgi:hypothetical protein